MFYYDRLFNVDIKMSTFRRQLSTLELSRVKLITKIDMKLDSNLLEALLKVSGKKYGLLYNYWLF